jgi:hypothetical protein
MHCIRAELQGERHGRVRGVQGLHFWHLVVSWCMIVRDASDPWCAFTARFPDTSDFCGIRSLPYKEASHPSSIVANL